MVRTSSPSPDVAPGRESVANRRRGILVCLGALPSSLPRAIRRERKSTEILTFFKFDGVVEILDRTAHAGSNADAHGSWGESASSIGLCDGPEHPVTCGKFCAQISDLSSGGMLCRVATPHRDMVPSGLLQHLGIGVQSSRYSAKASCLTKYGSSRTVPFVLSVLDIRNVRA